MQDQSFPLVSTYSFLPTLQPPISLYLVLLSPLTSSVWVQCTQGMVNSFFFFWLHWVIVAAWVCGLSSCSIPGLITFTAYGILVPWQGIEPLHPDWKADSQPQDHQGSSLCGQFFGYLSPFCLCRFSWIDSGNQSCFWKLATSVSWTYWQE